MTFARQSQCDIGITRVLTTRKAPKVDEVADASAVDVVEVRTAILVAVESTAVDEEPIVVVARGLASAAVKFLDGDKTSDLEVGGNVKYIVTVTNLNVAVAVRQRLFEANRIEL